MFQANKQSTAEFTVDSAITKGKVIVKRTPRGETVIRFTNFSFDTGSTVLPSTGKKVLKDLAVSLKHEDIRLKKVEGSADSRGNPDANLRLGVGRAKSTAEFLMENGVLGVTVSTSTSKIKSETETKTKLMVELQSWGAGRPIADNSTAAGQAANRTVEITVVDPKGTAFESIRNSYGANVSAQGANISAHAVSPSQPSANNSRASMSLANLRSCETNSNTFGGLDPTLFNNCIARIPSVQFGDFGGPVEADGFRLSALRIFPGSTSGKYAVVPTYSSETGYGKMVNPPVFDLTRDQIVKRWGARGLSTNLEQLNKALFEADKLR